VSNQSSSATKAEEHDFGSASVILNYAYASPPNPGSVGINYVNPQTGHGAGTAYNYHHLYNGCGSLTAYWYSTLDSAWHTGAGSFPSVNSVTYAINYTDGFVTTFNQYMSNQCLTIRTPNMGHPANPETGCSCGGGGGGCTDTDDDGLIDSADPEPETDNTSSMVTITMMQDSGWINVIFSGVEGEYEYGTYNDQEQIIMNIGGESMTFEAFVDLWTSCTEQVPYNSNKSSTNLDQVTVKNEGFYDGINDDWITPGSAPGSGLTDNQYLESIANDVFNTGSNLGITNEQLTEANKTLQDIAKSVGDDNDVDLSGVEDRLQQQIDTEADNRLTSGDVGDIFDGVTSYGSGVLSDAKDEILDQITSQAATNPVDSTTLDTITSKINSALPQASTCVPIDLSFQEHQIILDCSIADNIKIYMSWIMGVLTVFGVYNLIYNDLKPKV